MSRVKLPHRILRMRDLDRVRNFLITIHLQNFQICFIHKIFRLVFSPRIARQLEPSANVGFFGN